MKSADALWIDEVALRLFPLELAKTYSEGQNTPQHAGKRAYEKAQALMDARDEFIKEKGAKSRSTLARAMRVVKTGS